MSLLNLDKHLKTKKLIVPGDFYNQSMTRPKMIERFLKNWLSDKQYEGMSPWFTDMLDAYTTEVLLQAQKLGVEKMLLQGAGSREGVFDHMLKNFKSQDRYPLTIIPTKKLKPTKMKVDMEEINGDLASEVKTVLLSEVKVSGSIECGQPEISMLDVVNHA